MRENTRRKPSSVSYDGREYRLREDGRYYDDGGGMLDIALLWWLLTGHEQAVYTLEYQDFAPPTQMSPEAKALRAGAFLSVEAEAAPFEDLFSHDEGNARAGDSARGDGGGDAAFGGRNDGGDDFGYNIDDIDY